MLVDPAWRRSTRQSDGKQTPLSHGSSRQSDEEPGCRQRKPFRVRNSLNLHRIQLELGSRPRQRNIGND